MERMRVKSGNLRAIGYDESAQILEIEFHHGGIYRYFGVSKKVYDGLMNSQSAYERYHDRYIKTGLDTRRFSDCYTTNDLYILLLVMNLYTIDVRSYIIAR